MSVIKYFMHRGVPCRTRWWSQIPISVRAKSSVLISQATVRCGIRCPVRVGSFDRGINASDINKAITNYNNTSAGKATPAGQVLINNGLFTLAQLQQMGDGVAPHVCLAPPVVDTYPTGTAPSYPGSKVNLAWLKALDTKIAWTHTFYERFTVQPSVTANLGPFKFHQFHWGCYFLEAAHRNWTLSLEESPFPDEVELGVVEQARQFYGHNANEANRLADGTSRQTGEVWSLIVATSFISLRFFPMRNI